MNRTGLNIPDPDPIREPVTSSSGFGNNAFATAAISAQATAAQRNNFFMSGMQVPSSVFPMATMSAPFVASSSNNIATMQQQHQLQLPLMQQNQQQQQQQQTIPSPPTSPGEDEFVQEFIKAQWQRRFG